MATTTSSTEPDDGNVDFDTQLRLEQEEAKAKAAADSERDSQSDGKKIRTDEDGTVFDWDEAKQAWFPRIDSEMLIRYQLGYGTDAGVDHQPGSAEFDSLQPDEQEKARQYWEQYYSSQEYRDWYSKYSESSAVGADSQPSSAAAAGTAEPEQQQQQPNSKRDGKKKRKPDPQQQQEWFEVPADQNTHVFVQNLPLDLTEAEFIEFMSKCGMVLHDPLSRKPKVKLYTDEAGKFNGSARCGYIKKESVALALQILDGYRLKDCEISVEPAKFQPKAGFDSSKRRKLTNKEKKKVKEQQTRLLAWAPADSAASADGNLGVTAGANAIRRSDRVLIVSNVFSPAEIDADPLLAEKLRDDLVSRCSQYGSVRKAVLHDRNPLGVVQITFAESAECCLALSQLNGRVFRPGRVLKAEVWDGRTRHHVEETEEQAAARRAIWERQILGQEDQDHAAEKSMTENQSTTESIAENQSAAESISENQSAAESIAENQSTAESIIDHAAQGAQNSESTDDEAIASSDDSDDDL